MKIPFLPAAAAAFLFQAAIVGWTIADQEMILRSDVEVRFAVRPVDPRDLLRGEYVVLGYEISQLSTAALEGDRAFTEGDSISVTLRQSNGEWSAEAVHSARRDETEFPLAGRVRAVRSAPDCDSECEQILSVEYGIEWFFVPEGVGRELENLRNDQRLSVDVALDHRGRASIKRLLVDDEVRYNVSLFGS